MKDKERLKNKFELMEEKTQNKQTNKCSVNCGLDLGPEKNSCGIKNLVQEMIKLD